MGGAKAVDQSEMEQWNPHDGQPPTPRRQKPQWYWSEKTQNPARPNIGRILHNVFMAFFYGPFHLVFWAIKKTIMSEHYVKFRGEKKALARVFVAGARKKPCQRLFFGWAFGRAGFWVFFPWLLPSGGWGLGLSFLPWKTASRRGFGGKSGRTWIDAAGNGGGKSYGILHIK